MEKLKGIFKAPAFLAIFVLILFAIILVIFLTKEEDYGYLLLSDISSYKCTMKECLEVEAENVYEDNTKDIYNVFVKNSLMESYRLKYINKWNFFDLNNNWINLANSFIAGSEDLNLKVINYETREMTKEELDILNKILIENRIDSYSNLEQNEVLEYDFNKDGKLEKVILASNISDSTEDNMLFTIAISIVNNKSSIIDIDLVNISEIYKAPAYQIKGIINLLNNKEDYLVLLKGYFSENGKTSTNIYKVEKNKFKSIVKKENN